jgi:hypothetical protein
MVHEVKQGEYLFRIARQYGFRNPDNVWSDPNNAALRDLRPNHNVLFPGDQIFIPPFRKKEVACVTTRVHKFSVDVKNLRLALVINDANSDPIPNEQCVLVVDEGLGPETQTLTTGADGKIEKEISPFAAGGEVRVRGQVYFLKIGDLDPEDKESGQRARLANLGYYFGEGEDIDEEELRTAVEEFQCDHDLFVDGVCGPKTQKKLKQLHGC